jgi:class 3 adenylate cyclase
MWNQIDFRGVLPSVHVPTVAIFRAMLGDPNETGNYEDLVARIPGAKGVKLAPGDFPPWAADTESAVDALRDFIQATSAQEAEFDRVLASILFTDIVGSTKRAAELGDKDWRVLAERHHSMIRSLLNRYRGTEVSTAGDGFFATFDGPARAVRCAEAIVEAVQALGIEVRAGVHTGEVEKIDGKTGGLAVNIGARVGALAHASEILVSQTVKDLVAGSGLKFEDAGEHELKGVPDLWRLYRVTNEP